MKEMLTFAFKTAMKIFLVALAIVAIGNLLVLIVKLIQTLGFFQWACVVSGVLGMKALMQWAWGEESDSYERG